ncbi:hypothetical protein P154DRAFT_350223 [Amniculicola lignicola CBS 123094]|uniref:Uncharacterized protein n=1 Tax=Amniculicola lignicola CBS 123094 TaxID=1392246 RepID=A0A6A5W7S7_9PLEO|nr:hypothetical protein P154DRAFT_350223 [Amniculicola lignicola CBS 123094]
MRDSGRVWGWACGRWKIGPQSGGKRRSRKALIMGGVGFSACGDAWLGDAATAPSNYTSSVRDLFGRERAPGRCGEELLVWMTSGCRTRQVEICENLG